MASAGGEAAAARDHVLEQVHAATMQFIRRCTGKDSPTLEDVFLVCNQVIANWEFDPYTQTVTPRPFYAGVLRSRVDALLEALSERGLAWRDDSKMMQKYIRDGEPSLSFVVDSIEAMKFLIECTPYRMIMQSMPSRQMARAQLNSIRANAVRYYLHTHGPGAVNAVPPILLQLLE